MAFYIDQLGRKIELAQTPRRIVSLVPSQTELLFDLGIEDQVVGITKFCIHPQHWLKTKTIVGGTKQVHIGRVKDLQPDLIIANKEENVREQIEQLAKEFPVWVSDVNNLKDALQMIGSLGDITAKMEQAENMIDQIVERFAELQAPNSKLQTTYLIWKAPYMTVGGDTFINDMLNRTGFENIFQSQTRYPELSIEELQTSNCELVLLSSEPYPFQQKHVDELQVLLPGTIIILVDGEMFSWYGSRLLKAHAYFKQLQDQVLSLKHARGTE